MLWAMIRSHGDVFFNELIHGISLDHAPTTEGTVNRKTVRGCDCRDLPVAEKKNPGPWRNWAEYCKIQPCLRALISIPSANGILVKRTQIGLALRSSNLFFPEWSEFQSYLAAVGMIGAATVTHVENLFTFRIVQATILASKRRMAEYRGWPAQAGGVLARPFSVFPSQVSGTENSDSKGWNCEIWPERTFQSP